MINKLIWILILLVPAWVSVCRAEAQFGQIRQVESYLPRPSSQMRTLGLSIAAHGAASGFDAWTSWQRPERNRFLADGGRFGATSAYKKAGMFAGVSVLEVVVVKKWGHKRPWLVRACQIANFTTSGMLFSAGMSNLSRR